MPIDAQIIDGEGGTAKAGVTTENLLKVTNISPKGSDLTPEQLTRFQYYSDFFKETGGSKDMDVDGSVTPVEFFIQRVTDKIIYVKRIRFIFNDTQMNMGGGEAGRFASVSAGLTNGLELFSDQGGSPQNIFNEPVQIMADFWNYEIDFFNAVGAFGAGVDYLSWDFILEKEIVLTDGSVDKIITKISDNITALNKFNVIAIGFQEDG